MTIAITGETGFLGYHLTQHLKYRLGYTVINLTRDYQSNIHLVKQCDWLIHCAGINKGLTDTHNNKLIAHELTELLDKHDISINIAYASSVQEFYDTEYGNDKSIAGNILSNYCQRINTKFISYKLPNLFGPFGKPNYNSVVTTFCYNIVNNHVCNINTHAMADLCYVYDAIDTISQLDHTHTYITTAISIDDLYNKLIKFHENYSNGIIPVLATNFDIQLFNTYRSFSKCDHKFLRHQDERGYLIELLKSNMSQSQIFFSTTNPGVTRGNHFHFNKVERFCILKGIANISLRKLGSDEIIQYIVTDDMNMVVDMPILYTHNITNIGDTELVCVFWTNEIFDISNPDTYIEHV
jgi:UDP-2-acetamido-2,6-beta-L-arabino-hexul-4-ose reductase